MWDTTTFGSGVLRSFRRCEMTPDELKATIPEELDWGTPGHQAAMAAMQKLVYYWEDYSEVPETMADALKHDVSDMLDALNEWTAKIKQAYGL